MQKKCLVIIPAYNEEATIKEVVTRAMKHADVCVVDDASKDDTPAILRTIPGIHIIRHKINTHIPGGVLDGMRYAMEQGYEYGITMDEGLSHLPEEIPRFVEHGPANLVIGRRQVKINTPLFRRVLSTVGNLIYNLSLDFPRSVVKRVYYRDLTSGYRRYSADAMKLLLSKRLRSRSFDFLMESAMQIYRGRLSIAEVPITYNYSNSSVSKKVIKDCMSMCLYSVLNTRTIAE